jgi:drug/metabolite transporter (DMT)-like permease
VPVLWALVLATERTGRAGGTIRERRAPPLPLIAAGLFFAGDLAVWHWSIMLTSVANATLLANWAPIFVTLALWLVWGERPSGRFVAAMATALAGAALLIGGDFQPTPARLLGDALGIATAMFYAAYQLTLSRIGPRLPALRIMACATTVTALALLPLALASGGPLFPATAAGWLPLLGLALLSQVLGQSLIAHGIARLPATLSSVGLLLQPVMAGLFAWVLLAEALAPLQVAGGAIVLAGIWLARAARRR